MQIKEAVKKYYLKFALLLFLVLIGILTKFYNGFGFEFVHNHLGGLIYVVFWILFFSIIFPKTTPLKTSIWVFIVTTIIEFTQLIHTPILDKFREYFLFRALFGSIFNPIDLIYYLLGAFLGFFILNAFRINVK
ncbi:MAG: DUF2809 domain-containing protein [Bacteroidales bacterium]|nr:DUF2809 domain-containing protein [Bacteroidales bacterium]